jgi:hypothetical protein
MAIGYGPGSDMMKAYSENRSQLGKGKKLKDISETYRKGNQGKKLRFKEVSPSKLEAYKQKLILERQREKTRNSLIILSVSIFIIAATILLLF